MTNQHSLTPPLELVQQWWLEANYNEPIFQQVASVAAQWGADQELDACCELLKADGYKGKAIDLRNARRPKPPSLKGLKKQALRDLNHAYKKDQIDDITFENIQEALEALPND